MVKKITEDEFRLIKSKLKQSRSEGKEGEIAARAIGYKTTYQVYKCGESKHYHLTHTNPAERIGHGRKQATPTNTDKETKS